MAQEELNHRCSNGSSGGGGGNRSSKKLKQKKVPQRGLGVAQLEKIRLEEQQKKDALLLSNSLLSPINSSCSAVQSQRTSNFWHNPSQTNLSLPNLIFRPAPSIPNVDVLHPNHVPLSKPSNVSGLGQGNWPKLWNGEYNLEGENNRLDHNGFAFRSNLNLPYESNPIWPPPNVIQRTLQFQQLPSSSSMVNVSPGTSSSSEINYHQIEPPSNQSFYGNNYTPLWHEEEKMVGMKRPYPFPPDNPPGPSFPCKFPPIFVPPFTRSDESASCGNGGTVNNEPNNPIFREGPSSSTVLCELNPMKVVKENGNLNGDFLTLASPATALPQSSSKYKHPSLYQTPYTQELSELQSLPHQGSAEDPIHYPGPPKQPLYSFFPPAKARIDQATTTVNGCNGEVREKLGLDLKL
ncbi:hypothetical protein ACSBR2_011578 [Camellia fascicularis]